MFFLELLAFIEEMIRVIAGVSASPGFEWTRSGNSPPGSFLNNGTVPSNITGKMVFLNGAQITKFFVSNKNLVAYTIGIYTHDGDGINLTLLQSFSVPNTSRSAAFSTLLSVAYGKQIAIRVMPDSPGSPDSVVAGILLYGSL